MYIILSLLLVGLAGLLGHFNPGLNTQILYEKVPLAFVAVFLLYSIWRLIRERSRHSLVVITTEQVIVYDPVRHFRRVRVLDFAAVLGMVLQTVDATAPDTGHVTRIYCLALQNASGKEATWSLSDRYQYGPSSYRSIPVYKDIIAQFERHHTNQTAGLQAHRYVTDWRFVE